MVRGGVRGCISFRRGLLRAVIQCCAGRAREVAVTDRKTWESRQHPNVRDFVRYSGVLQLSTSERRATRDPATEFVARERLTC